MDETLAQKNDNRNLISDNAEPMKFDLMLPDEMEKYIEIRKQVIECLKEITDNENEFYEDDSLEEIGITSIAFIKLVVALEEKFGLSFDDEELNYTLYPNLISIFKYIYEKMKLVSDLQE